MKEMNSLTHSCIHSLASLAILALSGSAFFMIRATIGQPQCQHALVDLSQASANPAGRAIDGQGPFTYHWQWEAICLAPLHRQTRSCQHLGGLESRPFVPHLQGTGQVARHLWGEIGGVPTYLAIFGAGQPVRVNQTLELFLLDSWAETRLLQLQSVLAGRGFALDEEMEGGAGRSRVGGRRER